MMRDAVKFAVAAGVVVGLVLAMGNVVAGYRGRVWKGFGRFTIIKVGEKIEVASVDPKSKLGTRLLIPGDVEVGTLGQRGQWKPKSLMHLGGKFGWKWVGDSVADYLGIAYTGVWREMGVWDKLAWWNLARQAKWQEVDLAKTNLLVAQDTWDKERVLGISDMWGEKARELFYAQDLGNSGVEVRVWNSTTEPGLAGKVAGVLESAGLRVIQVGEMAAAVRDCEVAAAGAASDKGVASWLAATLGCQRRVEPDNGSIVEVFLGPGYAGRYKIQAK
jgi:hypothetical protein